MQLQYFEGFGLIPQIGNGDKSFKGGNDIVCYLTERTSGNSEGGRKRGRKRHEGERKTKEEEEEGEEQEGEPEEEEEQERSRRRRRQTQPR